MAGQININQKTVSASGAKPDIKVVHESEAQRQHVRVEIPARVKINGEVYPIKDLSAGGLRVYATREVDPEKAVRTLRLLFMFDVFAFHLDIKAQQLYFDAKKKIAGFRFVELNERQISFLNYLIRSYMTGAVIREGDLIHIVSRDNLVKVRKTDDPGHEEGWRGAIKRILPTAIIGTLGLAGLLVISGNLYESSSVIKSYQSVVESNEITIRAHTEGIFRPLLTDDIERVRKGQPIAILEKGEGTLAGDSIAGISGGKREIVINSPCDCYVLLRYVRDGEFRALGERMFTLVPAESRPWVSATVPPQQAHRLRLLDNANIKVAGEGAFIEGHITDIDFVGLEEPVARIKISPTSQLPADMVGRPAYAEFVVH